MTRPRPSFTPEPRVWTDFQVATRLGKSESWLSDRRAELEKLGFPKRDAVLGGTDANAIERWLDARAGLSSPPVDDGDGGLAGRLEAFARGHDPSAVSH